MVEKVIKLGTNRGQPRLWLEGKTLVGAGFKRGDKFTEGGEENPKLKMAVAADGKRTVSGKTTPHGDHPIIDINGGDLLKAFVGKSLKLKGDAGIITIQAEE